MNIENGDRVFCGTLKAGLKYVVTVKESPAGRNWTAHMLITDNNSGNVLAYYKKPFRGHFRPSGVHGAMKRYGLNRFERLT